MPRIIFAALLLCGFVSCQTKNGSDKNNTRDSLTRELNEVHQRGYINGFALVLADEKGTLYQKGFGYADKAAGKRYTDSTIQNIASVSKTFIGIALLKAQELGKLKLDDPIGKYLPFKIFNPAYPDIPITIRQLATHTSGITDNENYEKKDYLLKPGQDLKQLPLSFGDMQQFNPADSAMTLAVFIQRMLTTTGNLYTKNSFSKNKPGATYEYSNMGATLAAYIVGQATGQPFDRFTKQYILGPLQMTASGWHFEAVDVSKYSRLYITPDTMLPLYYMTTYPDGNFITSVNDMGKYLTELIKGYKGHGTLLSKESYAEYFRPQLTAANFTDRSEQNPYDDEYNSGIFIGFSFAGNIGHTGGDPGVSSLLFIDPKTSTGRFLVINTDFTTKEGNDEFYGAWDKLEKYQDRLQNR